MSRERMSAEDVFGIVGTTQAGNLRVERVVAEGGFGVVYRAHHGGFRAPVAIKCLKVPEEMTAADRDAFLEKFREEAELTFRLSAAIPEVCRPLHVDVLQLPDGRFVPFLAMEWLEGESLDGMVSKRRQSGLPPLGLHKVVKMMRPVAAALVKAHRFPGPDGAVAIIHRDLKPENLILASVGGVDSMKILDFGIAKAKRAATQAVGRATNRSVAEDEAASFTPAYGAPEQWAPKTWGETGPWTDVWGLALCVVEAVCGKPPIDGEPWMMRKACLDEKRRPTPRHGGADVPADIEAVFEQALAVDPRKRFQTIEAFWTELERCMGLPPSLSRRDDRREPEDSRPPPLPGARASLPPAAHAAPASAAGAGSGLDLEASLDGLDGLDGLATVGPTPVPSPGPAPPPTAQAFKRRPPSGALEFDLGAPASSSRRGAGRAVSKDLELPLPTGAGGPATSMSSGSLELSLPMGDGFDEEPPARAAVAGVAAEEASLPGLSSSSLIDRLEAAEHASEQARAASEASLEISLAAPKPASPRPRDDLSPLPGVVAARPPSIGTGARAAARPAPPASLYQPPRRSLRERLTTPAGVLGAGVVVSSLDPIFHRITGDHLPLGPLQPTWVGGVVALLGAGLLLWRLMEDQGDG